MSKKAKPARRRNHDPEDSSVPYEDVASVELDDTAQQLVRAGQIRTTFIDHTMAPSLRIDGPCARCGDRFTQTQALALPVSALRANRHHGGVVDRWADFLCDCDIAHPHTPVGERGCGASYSVSAPAELSATR